jgi:hypothetical protein
MASKRRNNARKRTPRQPAARKAPSPWKRALIWTGSVAGALILATVTAFGTGLGQKLVATLTTDAGPPVIIHAEYMQQSPAELLVVVPTQKDFDGISGFGGFQKYIAAVTKVGGAEYAPAYIQVVLRGNRTGPVVVNAMSVVKQCRAPLNGVINTPELSLTVVTGIGFDLDGRFPVAEAENDGTLSGAFFANRTISLEDGQTQTLLIGVTTDRHFCRFTFHLDVNTPADGEVPETVTDHGRPFSVTACPADGCRGVPVKITPLPSG